MGVGRKEWPPGAGEAHAKEIKGLGTGGWSSSRVVGDAPPA